MTNLTFRSLRADEVDVRVARVTEKGVQLLLYKDARCDMNILDEVVGPLNWKREHTRDNANCIVSIWDDDKKQWVSKEDTGTESNTEKEKGLASDSFKRACFNWGIGRELYTGPQIYVSKGQYEEWNGRPSDNFTVESMTVENGTITQLTILNKKGDTVFTFPRAKASKPQTKASKPQTETVKWDECYCEECGQKVLPIKTKAGTMEPHEILSRSFNRYGRHLCVACAKDEAQRRGE